MGNLIPNQIEGKKVDLSYSETFESRYDAIKSFKRAYKRLLNPRVWHELSGFLSAEFYLSNKDGFDPHRLAKIDDYLKIDIPGPGPSSGQGFDWVKVEEIEDYSDPNAEEEKVGMKLMPCNDPTNDTKNTAHFFTAVASSSFVIIRDGNVVISFYHGRNEVPNIKTTSATDNVRNAIVSSGALASLSEAQWMRLIKAFLQPEIGE